MHLQKEGLNLLDAVGLVSSTAEASMKIRNEDDVRNEIRAAIDIAKQTGINP